MAGGRLEENLGISEELIKKSCTLAFEAHKHQDKPYRLEKIRSSSSSKVIIISFPGSWHVKDWFADKPFGETKINLNLFPSLRSIGNDEAALVNEAFLRRFESIKENPSFSAEVFNSQLFFFNFRFSDAN